MPVLVWVLVAVGTLAVSVAKIFSAIFVSRAFMFGVGRGVEETAHPAAAKAMATVVIAQTNTFIRISLTVLMKGIYVNAGWCEPFAPQTPQCGKHGFPRSSNLVSRIFGCEDPRLANQKAPAATRKRAKRQVLPVPIRIRGRPANGHRHFSSEARHYTDHPGSKISRTIQLYSEGTETQERAATPAPATAAARGARARGFHAAGPAMNPFSQ